MKELTLPKPDIWYYGVDISGVHNVCEKPTIKENEDDINVVSDYLTALMDYKSYLLRDSNYKRKIQERLDTLRLDLIEVASGLYPHLHKIGVVQESVDMAFTYGNTIDILDIVSKVEKILHLADISNR